MHKNWPMHWKMPFWQIQQQQQQQQMQMPMPMPGAVRRHSRHAAGQCRLYTLKMPRFCSNCNFLLITISSLPGTVRSSRVCPLCDNRHQKCQRRRHRRRHHHQHHQPRLLLPTTILLLLLLLYLQQRLHQRVVPVL